MRLLFDFNNILYNFEFTFFFAWLLYYVMGDEAVTQEWIEVSYEYFDGRFNGLNTLYRSPPIVVTGPVNSDQNDMMLVQYIAMMEAVNLAFDETPRFHCRVFRGDYNRFIARRVSVVSERRGGA